MITLSGFADEISSDLEEQLDVLSSEGISNIELRGVWGKNVLELSDGELSQVKQRLKERNFSVSAIGSPIGKISITDDFEPHFRQFEKAVQLAHYFETTNIRIFSFYTKDVQPEQHRDEVMRRMRKMVDEAEKQNITLLHENEKNIYGDLPSRCEDLLTTCHSDRLRAAFDPANFVQCSVLPMTEAYPLIGKYVSYIHVKDAMMDTGKVVPAGQGDGQWRELLATLKKNNFSGYFSLEPHLKAEGELEGLSKQELFVVAIRSLKGLLQEFDMQWK